ncbi:MAG: 50S ribosomal protein L17 [Prevotellaceae bacterium]|jgi:large subunit ribosomal protein L17|nr:50S ribosomal protein L17 [Prevotellaceae bacterium]
MRHNRKFNHLGRTASHRSAMLSNMACSLIQHKRITTTVAKAKALRRFIEPLITKSKDDTMHSRRMVFSNLKDKTAVTELFREISVKIADRPGGYTRILRIGNRLGDAAEMCIIELVDYNENMLKEKSAKTSARTRRSRKGSSTEGAAATKTTKTAEPEKAKEAVKEVVAEQVEEKVEEATTDTVQEATEEVVTNKVEEATAENPAPESKEE